MSDLQHATFCVVDIETTGLDAAKDRICEIAFVLTTLHEVVYAADTFVNPGIPIPAAVSAIHHIVDRDVADAPTTLPYGIKLPPRDCYVAHNAAFDSAFLPALARNHWMCTQRLARRVLPGMEKFGNQFLRYALQLEVELAPGALPHRALPDALVTAALLRHLLANLPEAAPRTVAGLAAWSAEPHLRKKCRFGKHRGSPWSQVPLDYLQWMERSCQDLDVDTHHTMQHHLREKRGD